ncbi:choice-of-anchor P family protein, partial [Nocardioides sp. R-C-SC26]|uniref:choice-of-anchor P family protein n=1 Tax=Nocardioides sp. R-C-SC26 TaxID=2870414 RepID=UPI0027DF7147
ARGGLAESPTDTPTETPSDSPTTDAPSTDTPAPESPGNYTGFAGDATATPLKIEIFEPTIPIPANPQLEFSLMFTRAHTDTAGSNARASYLWPGAVIGEGLKTLLEQLGFPPEVVLALFANGYPVQSNAQFPGEETEAFDEPIPGGIQRAKAGERLGYASAGFSADGQPSDDAEPGEGNGGLLPGLNLPGLGDLLGIIGGGGNGGGNDEEETLGSAGLIPAPIAALVDLGGVTSVSRTTAGNDVLAQARSNLGDVSILGGLIKLEGVKVLSRVLSDGTKPVSESEVGFGVLTALGQKFRFGPDGFEAVGQKFPIPGLPNDPVKALSLLGITLSVSDPIVEKSATDGSTSIEATSSGLTVTLDLVELKKQLKPVLTLLDTIVGALPDQLKPLKENLQLITGLGPKVVVTLGSTKASVKTTPGIDFPTDPSPETPTDGGEETPTDNTGSTDGGGDLTPPSVGAPPPRAPPPRGPPGGRAPPPPRAARRPDRQHPADRRHRHEPGAGAERPEPVGSARSVLHPHDADARCPRGRRPARQLRAPPRRRSPRGRRNLRPRTRLGAPRPAKGAVTQ